MSTPDPKGDKNKRSPLVKTAAVGAMGFEFVGVVVGSFILGASALREFALALFVGMAAGTYSSVFLAGPALARWKERDPEWMEKQRRYGDRTGVSA